MAAVRPGGKEGNTGKPTGSHADMAKAAVKEMEEKPREAKSYEEVRSAKESQARKLESKYNDVLEPSVKMSITFTPTGQDGKDGDLDFRVVIAPNDEIQTGHVAIGSYPRPMPGIHGQLKEHAKSETPPDKRTRESHHVPAKGLARAMAADLTEQATIVNGKLSRHEQGRELARELEEAASAAKDLHANEGANLSAILIHPDTHRGDAGVHSANLRDDILTKIKQTEKNLDDQNDRLGDEILLVLNSRRELAVNPRWKPKASGWREYIRAARNWVIESNTETEPITLRVYISEAERNAKEKEGVFTKRHLEILLVDIREIISLAGEKAYRDAYLLGESALRAAFSKSDEANERDGKNPEGTLDELREVADEAWAKIRFPLGKK